jgi:ribosomal protein S18 acetylase RimI-like enzyme
MTAMATLRLDDVHAGHRAQLRDILVATNVFRDDEIDVAIELLDEGAPSYEFVGLFDDDTLVGYACYGATPGTDRTWDLYWIAVHPDVQGSGAGSRLLQEVEHRLRGQRLLLVETSSRTDYAATRSFYERRGYAATTVNEDYYAAGDDRVVYAKRLQE